MPLICSEILFDTMNRSSCRSRLEWMGRFPIKIEESREKKRISIALNSGSSSKMATAVESLNTSLYTQPGRTVGKHADPISRLPQSGQAVPRVDPKIAMQTIRNLTISQPSGLMSPSYSRSPVKSGLGSILQTPPDLTPTMVAQSPVRVPSSHRPRDPPLSYGVVVPAESDETRFEDPLQKMRDFINDLPSAEEPVSSAPPSFTAEPEQQEEQPVPPPERDRVGDAKKRADYRVKFSILREAYPHMNIPEPKEDQPIGEIEVMYRQYVKRIHIDSSVDQNKVYLLILWLIIEIVGSRFLKLPLGGYTKNQFKYMAKYQMLLIELGERSYSTSLGEGWPVELRLLAMAAFNGVIFVLVQMLAKKVGVDGDGADKMAEGLRETINEFLTQNKGADVLRRAEEANADTPPPPPASKEASPPLGGLGSLLATLAPMLANFGATAAAATAAPEKPQIKRPTTFGARRNREA